MCVWGRRIKNASRGAVKCNCREENIIKQFRNFLNNFFQFYFFWLQIFYVV